MTEYDVRFLQDNEIQNDRDGKALQLTFGALIVRSLTLAYSADANLFHVM